MAARNADVVERKRQRANSRSQALQLASALRSKRLRGAHEALVSSIDKYGARDRVHDVRAFMEQPVAILNAYDDAYAWSQPTAPGSLSESLFAPLQPAPKPQAFGFTTKEYALDLPESRPAAEALWTVPHWRRPAGCQPVPGGGRGLSRPAANALFRTRCSLGYAEYFSWLRSVLPEGERPAESDVESPLELSALELLRELGRKASAARLPEVTRGIPPLTEEEKMLASAALDGGRPKDVLVSRFNVSLTREQIECLLPGTWLNDEVINFYFKLLQERHKSPGYAKCWFANSFFWPKVSGSKHDTYSFKDVKRWTTKAKIDLFALDYMIFPMNIGETHWALGAIDFKAGGFRYLDSMFCSPPRNFVPFLRKYLDDEHKAKKGAPFPAAMDWELLGEAPPKQKNGYDCGVFTCFFGDYLSAEREMAFGQDDMPDLRLRLAARITRSGEDGWWADGG